MVGEVVVLIEADFLPGREGREEGREGDLIFLETTLRMLINTLQSFAESEIK